MVSYTYIYIVFTYDCSLIYIFVAFSCTAGVSRGRTCTVAKFFMDLPVNHGDDDMASQYPVRNDIPFP